MLPHRHPLLTIAAITILAPVVLAAWPLARGLGSATASPAQRADRGRRGEPAAPAQLPQHRWVELAGGGTAPELVHHTMVFDPGGDHYWIYGGVVGDAVTGPLSDVLLRRDATDPAADWQVVQAQGDRPPPLAYHSAVYDARRQRMLLYGGIESRDGATLRLAQKDSVWALDLRYPNRVRWDKVSAPGAALGRFGHAALYLQDFDAMLLSGGGTEDLRVLDDQVALVLGDDRPRWMSLAGAGIGPRIGHGLVYDSGGKRLIAFGGLASIAGSPDTGQAIGRAVSLDLSVGLAAPDLTWQDLKASGTPAAARAYMGAVLDPVRQHWWLQGGTERSRLPLRDLSVLDLSTAPARWYRSPLGDPGPLRWGQAAVWDYLGPRLVIHGGSSYLRASGSAFALEIRLDQDPPWPAATATASPTRLRPTTTATRSAPTPPSPTVAQSSPVPPIATCIPTPEGTTPPGLYPIVSVDSVVIRQAFDAADCPSVDLRLHIVLRNDGPAPSGPFAVRIEGCGVGRRDVEVADIEMLDQTTVEVSGVTLPAEPCALMLDPRCDPLKPYFQRHWSGPVPVPRPQPTCTPGHSPPPTATEGPGTATAVPATATEGSEDATATPPRLHLPRVGGA